MGLFPTYLQDSLLFLLLKQVCKGPTEGAGFIIHALLKLHYNVVLKVVLQIHCIQFICL